MPSQDGVVSVQAGIPPDEDVFTAEEAARAVGVPRGIVDAFVTAGALRVVAGSGYIPGRDILVTAGALRAAAAGAAPRMRERPIVTGAAPASLDVPAEVTRWTPSILAHAVAVLILIGVASLAPEAPAPTPEPSRLVFLALPGPGGGGGGGGLQAPVPAARLERAGRERAAVSVPAASPTIVPVAEREAFPLSRRPLPAPVAAAPAPIEPEPLPSTRVIAPVAARADADGDRQGSVDAQARPESVGAGSGGGSGDGAGTGDGPGSGAGIGAGTGGGTGGGVYRPGSGIDPPRLLHEVKALYTEEARRRGVTGEVLLEIVVTRSGAVGDVRLVRGLGAGLDERAIEAVRQWRFAPAGRLGEPVDVLVGVAVEFSLR